MATSVQLVENRLVGAPFAAATDPLWQFFAQRLPHAEQELFCYADSLPIGVATPLSSALRSLIEALQLLPNGSWQEVAKELKAPGQASANPVRFLCNGQGAVSWVAKWDDGSNRLSKRSEGYREQRELIAFLLNRLNRFLIKPTLYFSCRERAMTATEYIQGSISFFYGAKLPPIDPLRAQAIVVWSLVFANTDCNDGNFRLVEGANGVHEPWSIDHGDILPEVDRERIFIGFFLNLAAMQLPIFDEVMALFTPDRNEEDSQVLKAHRMPRSALVWREVALSSLRQAHMAKLSLAHAAAALIAIKDGLFDSKAPQKAQAIFAKALGLEENSAPAEALKSVADYQRRFENGRQRMRKLRGVTQ